MNETTDFVFLVTRLLICYKYSSVECLGWFTAINDTITRCFNVSWGVQKSSHRHTTESPLIGKCGCHHTYLRQMRLSTLKLIIFTQCVRAWKRLRVFSGLSVKNLSLSNIYSAITYKSMCMRYSSKFNKSMSFCINGWQWWQFCQILQIPPNIPQTLFTWYVPLERIVHSRIQISFHTGEIWMWSKASLTWESFIQSNIHVDWFVEEATIN